MAHLGTCLALCVRVMQSLTTAPLISVIVPAHNCEAYLGKAIASLTAQTIGDLEIIIVDDGSTDGTARVAAECARRDARIQVISRSKASGRPACARNIGLRVARGQYIGLLDADDIAMPHRFESSIAAMRRTGARFAFADYRRLHQDTGKIDRKGFLVSNSILTRAAKYLQRVDENVYLCSPKFAAFLLTFTAVHTPTVVFERTLLSGKVTGFDESLVCFEDVDLWFRFARRTRFVFVNEVHALYRRHAESITATNAIPTKLDGIGVRKTHLERLRRSLSPREISVAQKTIADLLWDVSYTNWCRGQLGRARIGFKDSWRTKPSLRAATGYLKAFVPRDAAVTAMDVLSLRRTGVYSIYGGRQLSFRA